MKAIRIAAAIVAAFLVSACLPVTSKTPLGTTTKADTGEALYGMWRGKASDSDQPGYFSFLKNDDGSLAVVLIALPDAKDNGEWDVFTATASTLGTNHYLNVRESFAKGEPVNPPMDSTIPVLYRLDSGKLTLYLLDEDATKAAFAAGELKGTIGKGSDPDVQLTSDATELDAFFATTKGAGLFRQPFITLTKVE